MDQQRRVFVWSGAVLAFFVVAGAVLLGTSLLGRHHAGSARPAATASASGLPTSAVEEPSPSDTPTSATPDPLPTADQMREFVVQYLGTATTDQTAAWQSLTPRFQSASGGFGSYQRYWRDITRAEPTDVAASPVDGLISYRVAYTHRSGATTRDVVRLHLLYTDGQFHIDAEG